jgi:hypothetical protein
LYFANCQPRGRFALQLLIVKKKTTAGAIQGEHREIQGV